jgi:hypothetical protein
MNLQLKKFQRRKEDFVCENCGKKVKGTGYTNHCPNCLWSRHVDINPGDRAAKCGGMMAPVGLEIRTGGCVITHRCVRCRHEKKNKVNAGDNPDKIIDLSRQ